MSYRHSSYRKLSKALMRAAKQPRMPDLTRTEINRIMHWSGAAGVPKSDGWGRSV